MKIKLLFFTLALTSLPVFSSDFLKSMAEGITTVSTAYAKNQHEQEQRRLTEERRRFEEQQRLEREEAKRQRDRDAIAIPVALAWDFATFSWNSMWTLYNGFAIAHPERMKLHEDNKIKKQQKKLFYDEMDLNYLAIHAGDINCSNKQENILEKHDKNPIKLTQPSYHLEKAWFNFKHAGLTVGGIGLTGAATAATFMVINKLAEQQNTKA